MFTADQDEDTINAAIDPIAQSHGMGRALSFDDVMHYQKIIKILCETDRIMREIVLPL